MNKEEFIQFFTSFLNKVISKSLKIMELLIISSSLLALLNRIKPGVALRSKESQALRDRSSSLILLLARVFIASLCAQSLTLDQVVGCGASGSKRAGSENSPSWYLPTMAAWAAFPTLMKLARC